MVRPETEPGFLSNKKIDQDGEVFQYIVSCHEAMWELVRLQNPGASGNIWDYVEKLTKGPATTTLHKGGSGTEQV